jgi:renalase
MIYDHVIIGAGLSGLFLGLKLHKAGKNFLILEKSKGVGGRIATRRINELGIDHGATFLYSHNLLFELIHEFHPQGAKISNKGIYLDDGMTSLPKKMAQNLPIKKEVKIIHIEKKSDVWISTSDSGDAYHSKSLIITAPIPQALELLKCSKIPYTQGLHGIQYTKGLLGLFTTDEQVLIRQSLPENVHSVLGMKDRNLHPTAFVLRVSEKLSEELFEKGDEENITLIEKLFKMSCENAPFINHRELKKWRYVVPQTVLQHPYLCVQEQLYLIGDGFLYPDIRGALLSAQELAKKLI